jgi:hypothetical protein
MPENFHLVLNELSLDPPAASRAHGAQRMVELREILDHVFAWVPALQQVLLVPESTISSQLSTDRYKAAFTEGEYRAHWNGSTDPTANADRFLHDNDIPPNIRERFPARRLP